MKYGDGTGLPQYETYGPARLNLPPGEVFMWTVGMTTKIVEDGWCGVIGINYAEGWIDIDTRYRWTRDERLAMAGPLRRSWMRLVRK